MDIPMSFAIIEDGIVNNVIWLRASERLEFPNSVCVEDRRVAIGDQYIDGEFYSNGELVPKYTDVIADLTAALAIIKEAINE